MFKIKDGYKLELQTPDKMELFGSTKKLNGKIKKGEKVPSFEVVQVVLVLLVQVLYTFTSSKSYPYLLIVETSNLVFLKTYTTEIDEIIITFTN